jgi:hypothetical protein
VPFAPKSLDFGHFSLDFASKSTLSFTPFDFLLECGFRMLLLAVRELRALVPPGAPASGKPCGRALHVFSRLHIYLGGCIRNP